MTSSLVPSSSASHGITLSQNVARDVAERIDEMRKQTGRSRIASWAAFGVPALATAMLAVTDGWAGAFVTGYLGLIVAPVVAGLHLYKSRALKQANVVDRNRDVAWVSRKDGLIFLNDDGVYVEKRGGFKPYGIGPRQFRDVSVVRDRLLLHGRDLLSGGTYTLDVSIPDGWTDADTARVREKLEGFRVE